MLQTLRRLVKHVQITGIRVFDPLERELPQAGHYVVSDHRGRSSLETGNRSLATRYRDDFEQHIQTLRSAYQGLRIPLIPLSTEQARLPVLQRYFAAR